ncbi:mechanosensitive ion channel domain-containing protein [Sulfurimonas sp.]|uniref:mechanosensitive ion channel family protein n=1 Tax=Sulfurimonas sp. TaxID=2022749 RepID=UPI00286DFB5D|nr:mechanosensitive ion channel domain-containing protein [Sulfurimonas sp.]
MKIFILLASIACAIWASSVDTKLYEDTQKKSYYEEIQKQLDSVEHIKKQPKDVLQEERLYLTRVRDASSQDIQIELYDLKILSKKSISFEIYYNAINEVALLRVKQEQNRRILQTINEKSAFSKNAIENIIEEEKARLLSYQLQHAYYKLQEKNIEAKLQLMQAHEKEIMEAIFDSLARIKCDSVETIDKKIKHSDKEIEKVSLQKIALQIDLEKALIEDSARIEYLKERIKSSETLYQQLLNNKVVLQIEQALYLLSIEKNKLFFNKIDEIEKNIKSISKEMSPLYKEQLNVIREIATEVFGSTKLFFSGKFHEVVGVFTQFKEYFISPIFVFSEQPISLVSLLKTLLFIIVGFVTGMLYKRWVRSISFRWPSMSQMSIRLASNIGYYLIIIISFMIAVGSLGIDMTSISLIAGALSIGIGFGLQTVVSNLIAGIILMFERTIRIGDTIEISDTLRGTVTDMRIRSTTIKTVDNIDIIIPNSSFIQNNVINWTLEDTSKRQHISFIVAYGTDIEYLKKVVLDELEHSDLKYIRDDGNKQPEVWMKAMNSSSIDFELLVWVEWDNKLRPNSLKSDFLILIYNTLNKYGIQIPFPQLDLHVKHMQKDTVII